jgi:GNAT superfamily N-acetyltransferase
VGIVVQGRDKGSLRRASWRNPYAGHRLQDAADPGFTWSCTSGAWLQGRRARSRFQHCSRCTDFPFGLRYRSPPRKPSIRHQAYPVLSPSKDPAEQRRALVNQTSWASRTFVVTDDAAKVVGYYALAAGAVSHDQATSKVRRNMPDPVPVLVLGRLAVDRSAQGMSLGSALLQDAVKRAAAVTENASVRALLVHALHDRAKAFYEGYGFQHSPTHPLTLLLRLQAGV